ncbi:U4/U6.U5 snRNP associated protein [Ceraceosorus bombacis]|uniref:U4/U6.U5 snRNP associated protein n=1 Tax=Ceraceosorus bombacis TaxID=401625 RepID=A0A0P1BJ22_9BASI|nr:U4/U6.U5 snRNP associated protein [Ceraceosorus bombacis]
MGMSEFAKDSLSLQETNKLRISLGLKPLTEDSDDEAGSGDALQGQEERAEENYRKRQQEQKRQREQDEVKERIAKARNRRELARKLQGPTLGDGDGDGSAGSSSTTLKWLKASQKRAKEIAARRAKELEEQDAAALDAYGSADLAGLRVAHNVDEMGLSVGGDGRVLTLRDADVLDGQEDELMDVAADQKELDRLNAQRRKGAKGYTGLDDDDFDAPPGQKRGVLSKLGEDHAPKQEADEERKREAARLLNRTMLDLNYDKNQEVSDYLQEGDAGFKRPKSRKKRRTARVKLEDDATASDFKPREISTENFVDDDELAASLAKERRNKAKRTITKMTPEEIARNLAAQEAAESNDNGNDNGNGSSPANPAKAEATDGLTFDDTSEFVRNIQQRPASPRPAARRSSARGGARAASPVRSPEATTLAPTPSAHADDVEDVDMSHLDDLPIPQKEGSNDAPEFGAPEQYVSSGMAATLAMLRNQGMLQARSAEEMQREQAQKEYDAWMAKRRAEDRVRQAEREMSKAQGAAKDQATREYENRMRELEDARQAQDKFRDYKPDIKIEYHDEHGRVLGTREAWKNLSHTFHGKMPGKKRQELNLKRIEEERKREKMTAGDTPTGMSGAFAARAERAGQAHMVIGVGSRNNAPQELELLGPNIAKPSASAGAGAGAGAGASVGKGKSRRSNAPTPLGAERDGRSASATPAPDLSGTTSMVPRAAQMKPAFAPVKAKPVPSSASSSTSSNATQGSRFKLAFGKRASDEAHQR